MNKGLDVSGWVTLLIAGAIFVLVALSDDQTTSYRKLRSEGQRSMQQRHEDEIRWSNEARNDALSLLRTETPH